MGVWVGLGVYWALTAIAPSEGFDSTWFRSVVAAVAFGLAAMHLHETLKDKK
jgi:hypothetical protein